MKVGVLLLLSTVFGSTHAGILVEPRTGISFPDTLKGFPLTKIGVRTKGPLKVYAVGLYEKGPRKSFMLKMSYGVGSAKMTAALADGLKPRCSDAVAISSFESCMLKGLPDGAPKGTSLTFDTSGGKLSVAVNDKPVGVVASKPLASAFVGLYCDSNAVCKMKPVVTEADEMSGGGSGVVTGKHMFLPRRLALAGAALGFGTGFLIDYLHR